MIQETEKSPEKVISEKKFSLTIQTQWWDSLTESELHEKIRAIELAGIVYWTAERKK